LTKSVKVPQKKTADNYRPASLYARSLIKASLEGINEYPPAICHKSEKITNEARAMIDNNYTNHIIVLDFLNCIYFEGLTSGKPDSVNFVEDEEI